jgi:hypothetical protein
VGEREDVWVRGGGRPKGGSCGKKACIQDEREEGQVKK